MAPKKKSYSSLGKTAKYYRNSPKARRKKASTDKKINSRSEQKKKRSESGSKRYAAKKAGKKLKGLDYDHSVNRFVKSKTNRGRRGEGNR